MKTFKELAEAYRLLSDNKIDNFIKKEWGTATTYTFDTKGAVELAQVLPDIIVTKDKKYIHIPGILNSSLETKVQTIVKKYNMRLVK